MIRAADVAGFDGVMLSASACHSLKDPSIHAGRSFIFHHGNWIEKNIETEAALSSSSSRNDQKLPLTTVSFSDRSVYSGYGQWKAWHQPGNGGTSRPAGSYSRAKVGQSLNVAVAAEFLMFSLRKFWEKEVYLTCKKKLMEILLEETINERWLSYAISSWQRNTWPM